jgi:hypothetical protein
MSVTVVCITLNVKASNYSDSIVVGWQSNPDCHEDKTPWLGVLGGYYSCVVAIVAGVTAWYARRRDFQCSAREGAFELMVADCGYYRFGRVRMRVHNNALIERSI